MRFKALIELKLPDSGQSTAQLMEEDWL